MFDDIKKAIQNAEKGKMMATLHLEVLLNAARVRDVPAKVFCEQIGVPQSYATEVSKMVAVDDLMGGGGRRII
ncbi:MAG: transcription factor [Planctomycetes bacterium]|nr:transcription factor [Planctomycetota bacterium]